LQQSSVRWSNQWTNICFASFSMPAHASAHFPKNFVGYFGF
jgi:hypothetical protein